MIKKDDFAEIMPEVKIIKKFPESGQKDVFLVRHKDLGIVIAKIFKSDDKRIEREIEIITKFSFENVENMAFMHYLETLKRQAKIATKDTFEKTVAHNELMLKVAEQKINYLEENGVYAQSRSFKDIIDVNRSAIQRIQKTRGFMLKHSWKDL